MTFALIPFAWYVVLVRHSFVHSWFTCKALTVFTFAVSSFICCNVKNEDVFEEGENGK